MRAEHPLTKKARLAVEKVNGLQHTLRCVQAEIEKAKVDMADTFGRLERSGEPPEPWENHWRINHLGMTPR